MSRESLLSPSEAPSPEQTAAIRQLILSDLFAIIARYEPYYAPSTIAPHFPRERYAAFEHWLGSLAQGACCSDGIDQLMLRTEVARAASLYEALQALRHGRPLEPAIRKRYELRPGWFQLEREKVPYREAFPSAKHLKERFRLEIYASGWRGPYPEGKSLRDDFALTLEDLLEIGFEMDDPLKADEFIGSITENHPEEILRGRLWKLGDILKQDEKLSEERPTSLHPHDLFEAFDRAGVRPATCAELFAYAELQWQPIVAQGYHPLNAPYIWALGSAFNFSEEESGRSFPYLLWTENNRWLSSGSIERSWDDSQEGFLVFEKD